jgi:hypothetical protein
MGCYDFWFKNAGTTYQRAMNLIFHELLGIVLEIYIDDVVIKSNSVNNHLANLRLALEKDASVWVKNEFAKMCLRCVGG